MYLIKVWLSCNRKHYQSTSNNQIKEAVFKFYDTVTTKLGSDEVFDAFCSDEEDLISGLLIKMFKNQKWM